MYWKLFFLFVFIPHSYAQIQGGNQAYTEEELMTCGYYDALINELTILNRDTEHAQNNIPGYCSGLVITDVTSSLPPSQTGEDDLPKEVDIDQRICYGDNDCETYRFRFRFYKCGESMCYKLIRLRKKCGLFCWEEKPLLHPFDLPTEIRPKDDDGWTCVDIPMGDDPYEEIQSCLDENGNQCSTDDLGTTCKDSNGNPITVPQGIPKDGFGDPPADENP